MEAKKKTNRAGSCSCGWSPLLTLVCLVILNPTLSKSKSVLRAYKLKFSPLTPSCSRSRSSDGHLQVGKPPECSGKIYLPPALPSSTNPGELQPNSFLESFAVTKCWVISEASCLAAEDEKREMEELRKSSLLLFEQFWQLLCHLSLIGVERRKKGVFSAQRQKNHAKRFQQRRELTQICGSLELTNIW